MKASATSLRGTTVDSRGLQQILQEVRRAAHAPEGLVVREALPKDFPEYGPLAHRLLTKAPENYANDTERLDFNALYPYWLREIHITYLIAELHGTSVGRLTLSGTGDGIKKEPEIGELEIWVKRKSRNKRVGTALMLDAIDLAMLHGYAEIKLTVSTGNARAVHLCKKLGFVPITVCHVEHGDIRMALFLKREKR